MPQLHRYCALILAAGAAAQHAQRDDGADSAEDAYKEQHSTDGGSQRHSLQHRSADILALLLPVGELEASQIRLQVVDVFPCDALTIIKLKLAFGLVAVMMVVTEVGMVLLIACMNLLQLVCDVCGIDTLQNLDSELLDAVRACCTALTRQQIQYSSPVLCIAVCCLHSSAKTSKSFL